MTDVTVLFGGEAWKGYLEGNLIRFDYRSREGRSCRWFAVPSRCVVFGRRPWPDEIVPYTEWFVHLADIVEEDPQRRIWRVIDRDIDIIIEADLQTYRVIDLEDFCKSLSDGELTLSDAQRILRALQDFLDLYLHGGGRFPPREVLPWLDETPKPEAIAPGA